MQWRLSISAVCLLAAHPTGSSFTPATASRTALLQLRTPLRPQPVLPSKNAQLPRSRLILASASAIATPSLPSLGRALTRFAMLCASSLLIALLRVTRAFAAERTMRAAAAPSAASVLLNGGTLKYGGLALVLGAMYAFRKEETPILTETLVDGRPVGEYIEAPSGAEPEQDGDDTPPPPTPVAPEASSSDELPTSLSFDDSSLTSALAQRMQQLADERANANDDQPRDSSEGWGTGDTAVLEPPQPNGGGLLEGPPSIDFPVGFPLVDGDVIDNQPLEPSAPLASQDDVEMLKRMFGSA